MSEEKIPALPTRQQEKDYLHWLEGSFATDPFLTLHPKLYSAGPHRMHFKYSQEMKKEKYKTFLKNFVVSAVLSWPLIIL